MRPEIRALLDQYGGVVTRAQLLAVLPVHVVDHAVESRALVRLFPCTYTAPQGVDDPAVRQRGALRYAGDEAALSHTSGLAAYGISGPPDDLVHVTTDRSRRLRHAAGLVVHHHQGFVCTAPAVVTRAGLDIVRLERCLVDSWPLLSPLDRRAAVICAVQSRRSTAARVTSALQEAPKLAGRAELAHLLHLLELGCHSELEIWGHLHVFTSPLLPPARRSGRSRWEAAPSTWTSPTTKRWSPSSSTAPPSTPSGSATSAGTSPSRREAG